MRKTLAILLAVLFLVTVTAGTVSALKVKVPEITKITSSLQSGNVLKNDKESGIKVISMSKTANGGKVTMKSNRVGQVGSSFGKGKYPA